MTVQEIPEMIAVSMWCDINSLLDRRDLPDWYPVTKVVLQEDISDKAREALTRWRDLWSQDWSRPVAEEELAKLLTGLPHQNADKPFQSHEAMGLAVIRRICRENT